MGTKVPARNWLSKGSEFGTATFAFGRPAIEARSMRSTNIISARCRCVPNHFRSTFGDGLKFQHSWPASGTCGSELFRCLGQIKSADVRNLSTACALVHWRISVNRLLKLLILLAASIYFLVDAVFFTVARPVALWFADRKIFEGLREWIMSLSPYATASLFVAPLIVLEPAKPVAAYLTATGHLVLGLGVFVLSEIIKLVLLERLFAISRDKLMSIAAFAWAYRQYRQIMDWVEETDAWQAIRRLSKIARYAARSYLLQMRQRPRRISFE